MDWGLFAFFLASNFIAVSEPRLHLGWLKATNNKTHEPSFIRFEKEWFDYSFSF
jgi:hypothetical protein